MMLYFAFASAVFAGVLLGFLTGLITPARIVFDKSENTDVDTNVKSES